VVAGWRDAGGPGRLRQLREVTNLVQEDVGDETAPRQCELPDTDGVPRDHAIGNDVGEIRHVLTEIGAHAARQPIGQVKRIPSMKRLIVALALVVCSISCGSSPTGPTGNDVVDVAGVWNFSATLSSVTGGECIGTTIQPSVGNVVRGTISITQTGATLTATTRASTDGSSCTYTGTAGQNSFALGWQTCDAGRQIGATCTNGARRDFNMVTNSINATKSGNTLAGTQAESFNVLVAGTNTNVGVLVLNANFTASR